MTSGVSSPRAFLRTAGFAPVEAVAERAGVPVGLRPA